MSSKRFKKDYMVSEDNLSYIEQVKEKNNLKYYSEALDLIIREHKNKCEITTDYLVKVISDKVSEKVKLDIESLKQGLNSTDKNSQILIELLNAMFFKEKYGKIVTTNEDTSPGLKMATEEVEKRIINRRNIKLDNEF